MKIFIYDDVRTIKSALGAAGEKMYPDHEYSLVRPFRHDGEQVVCDHENAKEMISNNQSFDVWILDNDLGPGVEGYDFLKECAAQHPDKMPEIILSCSSNFEMRKSINTFFQNWKKSQA